MALLYYAKLIVFIISLCLVLASPTEPPILPRHFQLHFQLPFQLHTPPPFPLPFQQHTPPHFPLNHLVCDRAPYRRLYPPFCHLHSQLPTQLVIQLANHPRSPHPGPPPSPFLDPVLNPVLSLQAGLLLSPALSPALSPMPYQALSLQPVPRLTRPTRLASPAPHPRLSPMPYPALSLQPVPRRNPPSSQARSLQTPHAPKETIARVGLVGNLVCPATQGHSCLRIPGTPPLVRHVPLEWTRAPTPPPATPSGISPSTCHFQGQNSYTPSPTVSTCCTCECGGLAEVAAPSAEWRIQH